MSPEALRPRAGIYSRQSQGNAKSISDQNDENRAAANDNNWRVTAVYSDGKSAWRGRATRDDWERVLGDIEAGQLDILILWEPSRGDRDAERWLGLLRRCRTARTRIFITSEDTLYDLGKTRDWRHLAEQGLDSEVESDKISKRVERGQRSAAAAGKPSHGRTPYGYVRSREVVPNPQTGKPAVVVHQTIDEDTAEIVREIFTRIGKHVPVATIVRDLNNRSVPTLTARRWYHQRVLEIARNVAYMGIRRMNGADSAGDWPRIVEPAEFYAVQRILTGPGHKRTSPGQQRHLLSYLALCHGCGAVLNAALGRYKCRGAGCVTILQAPADELVRDHILARLEQPDVYEKLRRAGADSDRAVLDARNEIATLRGRLEAFRESARRGQTTPESLAFMEAALDADIKAAQRREVTAAVPPALRAFMEPGADVAQRWEDATLQGRRELIRALAEVRVSRAAAPGSRRFEPERLGVSRWLGSDRTWADLWAEGD